MDSNLKRMRRPKVVNDFGKKYDFNLQENKYASRHGLRSEWHSRMWSISSENDVDSCPGMTRRHVEAHVNDMLQRHSAPKYI